jgi:hypothetical protein
VQRHLNREQQKKIVGMRMQIQSVAYRLDETGKLLDSIDADRLVAAYGSRDFLFTVPEAVPVSV